MAGPGWAFEFGPGTPQRKQNHTRVPIWGTGATWHGMTWQVLTRAPHLHRVRDTRSELHPSQGPCVRVVGAWTWGPAGTDPGDEDGDGDGDGGHLRGSEHSRRTQGARLPRARPRPNQTRPGPARRRRANKERRD